MVSTDLLKEWWSEPWCPAPRNTRCSTSELHRANTNFAPACAVGSHRGLRTKAPPSGAPGLPSAPPWPGWPQPPHCHLLSGTCWQSQDSSLPFSTTSLIPLKKHQGWMQCTNWGNLDSLLICETFTLVGTSFLEYYKVHHSNQALLKHWQKNSEGSRWTSILAVSHL